MFDKNVEKIDVELGCPIKRKFELSQLHTILNSTTNEGFLLIPFLLVPADLY